MNADDVLHDFIVRAKAACYVGNGSQLLSSRPGSHDLQFYEVPYTYLDSYFGGTNFIGQESVYQEALPVWAMNYYGYILRPDVITAAQAGLVIQTSLTQLYQEGRFLGGFRHTVDHWIYTDSSEGDYRHFTGMEWITIDGVRVYELVYHGGLIKA